MPNVEQGYVKQVKAVRIGMTTRTQLPAVAPSYTPDLTTVMPDGQRDEAAWLVSDRRTIKAHYGYVEASSDTIQYVVPVDVTEVRPKDMDKGYMVLGTAPIRANDRYKDDEKNVDAHAQEQAFLAAVAAQSSAATGVVKLALELIKWIHGPVNRHSGEPFYLHPLAVAQIVMEYDADRVTILGALLHDTVEDTAALLGSLEHVFGREATEVVDVVTHLQSVENGIHKVRLSEEENIQMLERTGNKRALYVKIADRLHNVRTIEGHKKLQKQKEVATETMQVFVPLAKRLGLNKTAAEFEERCEAVLCKKG
ncbi:MAG: HD domain-containing protein, partial [Bacteroidota bacterium]